jgi:hypothetical protein
MDETTFDALTRSVHGLRSRRGVVGALTAALAAATGLAIPTAAAGDGDGPDANGKQKGKGGNGNNNDKKKNKRCRKANQTCGGQKKCCKGLICTDGRCAKKDAPECTSDTDCDDNESCQNGTCVPDPEPDCFNDGDCAFNERCIAGVCFCDLEVNGTCVRPCEVQNDCPGEATCRNHFPEELPGSPPFENGVCVDEAFLLCDTASCQTSGDSGCADGEICVAMDCATIGVTTFRCQDIAVGNDFEN